jgi:biopolymer transport protein ExbB
MIADAVSLGILAQVDSAPSGVSSVSVLRHFVVDGGPITWFVLIPLSVVTLSLAVHYLFTIRRKPQVPTTLAQTLVNAATRGEVRKIVELTNNDDSMLGQAGFAAATHIRDGGQAAREAVDEAVEEHATRLLRRIEYLNVIGNIAPMIGLLGTVVGMIQAFSRIFAAGGGMPDAGKLAGDIAVALVTTFWGILIAIPALTFFAIFRNRVDGYAAECMKLCDSIVSILSRGPSPTLEQAQRAAKSQSPASTSEESPSTASSAAKSEKTARPEVSTRPQS